MLCEIVSIAHPPPPVPLDAPSFLKARTICELAISEVLSLRVVSRDSHLRRTPLTSLSHWIKCVVIQFRSVLDNLLRTTFYGRVIKTKLVLVNL